MDVPINPIILPPANNPEKEKNWLQKSLHKWLNEEFITEEINRDIAERTAQVFMRQRMEGENDLGCLMIAIIIEMKSFDFSESFYGELEIANAVSYLLVKSLDFDNYCGQ